MKLLQNWSKQCDWNRVQSKQIIRFCLSFSQSLSFSLFVFFPRYSVYKNFASFLSRFLLLFLFIFLLLTIFPKFALSIALLNCVPCVSSLSLVKRTQNSGARILFTVFVCSCAHLSFSLSLGCFLCSVAR